MAETVRLIKKYPNRRLYDTKTSAYITLADVKALVLKYEEFQIIDAKSNEDLTRAILLQIILEEEAAGSPMFSSEILTQFIRFYGTAMQTMVGAYLERNIMLFNELQKKMKEQSQALYGDNAKLNQDWWNQFLAFQGPAMQGLISTYLDQSRNMFVQMQEQLQSQTRNLFSGFPFAGAPGAPASGDGAKTGDVDGEKKT